MEKLDQLLSLYTRLIGVNGLGDPGVDRDLCALIDYEDPDFCPTGLIDHAISFLEMALPDWQIHVVYRANCPHNDSDYRGLAGVQSGYWYCNICQSENSAGGYGRTAAVAILSATAAQLISDLLTRRGSPTKGTHDGIDQS
jgi:hypothetical protein